MKRDDLDQGLTRFGRLTVIMEDWADWCRRYSGIAAPRGSICLTSGYTSSKSFDDMLDEVENAVAKMVDAAVDDLVPGQRAAINQRYGVTAVFRFPRGNYPELLFEAHETLTRTLPKKGVVI